MSSERRRRPRSRPRGDLPGGGYDYVVGTAILCHDAYGDNLKALEPLLKPGGQILFFEANFWNPQVLVKSLVPWAARRAGNPRCQIGMRKYRLLQETSRQGFVSVEIIPYDILHPRAPTAAIPAVQSTAYLLEQLPGVRELCGTLYIWARKPGDRRAQRRHDNLARHARFHDSTSVVIPCHNEAETLPRLHAALTEAYDDYIHELVIVDDCEHGRDRRGGALRSQRGDPRVKLVRATATTRGSGGRCEPASRPPPDATYSRWTPTSPSSCRSSATSSTRSPREAKAPSGAASRTESILVNYPLPKILANRLFHFLLRP